MGGIGDNDQLVVGTAAMKTEVFDNQLKERQIYRLLEAHAGRFGAFKLLGKWCGYRDRMRNELHRQSAPPPMRRTR